MSHCLNNFFLLPFSSELEKVYILEYFGSIQAGKKNIPIWKATSKISEELFGHSCFFAWEEKALSPHFYPK